MTKRWFYLLHAQDGKVGDRMRQLLICRCEEVTEEEVRQAVRNGAYTVAGVRRRTRAGMGLCQGHTCSKLVARIISEETGRPLAGISPSTSRPPVRPLPARILSATTVNGEMGVLLRSERAK